jgi:carbamoyltransferase
MTILGISSGSHDAAVTAIADGKILFAAHAERYSKIKHDAHVNSHVLADAVAIAGEPSALAFYERPWLKKTRQIYAGQWQCLQEPWTAAGVIYEAVPQLRRSQLPIHVYGHHLSHAAAGFQTSKFHSATVVVIDAIGEWDTASIWQAHYDALGRARYRKLWRQIYPHSIGLMYSAFTAAAGLRPMDEEYILMGMAAWGQSRDMDFMRVSNDCVADDQHLTFKHNFHLGIPDALWRPAADCDMAATTQCLTEQLIGVVMRKAQQLAPNDNLVYAGGVALNCVANATLGHYFDNIWIMPNPGDAGSSLGAAALAYGKQLSWQDAYLGHEIPGRYPVKDLMTQLVTAGIVGVAHGRAEFGPRALGNRSLLADPRGPDIKARVNIIKRRQQFRPFAPVILEELAAKYFAMPPGWQRSEYMQVTAKCLYPEQFPAIIHVDGTSRVQTVGKNCHSGIRQLLEAWYAWTGCPMLLNTSLNVRGEPMVNDRTDADRFEQLYNVKVMS